MLLHFAEATAFDKPFEGYIDVSFFQSPNGIISEWGILGEEARITTPGVMLHCTLPAFPPHSL